MCTVIAIPKYCQNTPIRFKSFTFISARATHFINTEQLTGTIGPIEKFCSEVGQKYALMKMGSKLISVRLLDADFHAHENILLNVKFTVSFKPSSNMSRKNRGFMFQSLTCSTTQLFSLASELHPECTLLE